MTIKDKVEKALRDNFGGGGYPLLERSLEYSLFSNGKRIRGGIILFLCEKFNVDEKKAAAFAAAVEMIHAYSLVHDDLPSMDNDEIRRGVPTTHIAYGEGIAILTGDALLNLAFETLLSVCENEKDIKAMKIIATSSGRLGMCSGQAADLFFENKTANLNDAIYINANKTGALLKACFVVPAILGSNERTISLLAKIGSEYGELFQLADDLKDKEKDKNKNTYLNIAGEEETKKRINALRDEILAYLVGMDIDTKYLQDLVNYSAKC